MIQVGFHRITDTGLDDSRVLSVCSANLNLSMFRWRTSVELRQWMLSRVQCVDMCWLHFSRFPEKALQFAEVAPWVRWSHFYNLLYGCVWCVWKLCIPYSIPQMAIWIGTIILRFFRVPEFQTHTKSPSVTLWLVIFSRLCCRTLVIPKGPEKMRNLPI